MSSLQELVDLALGKNTVKIETLHKLSIYLDEHYSHFQKFLVTERIAVFLQLLVIDTFCKDTQFVVGCENTTHTRYLEEMDEEIQYGPTIVNNTFSSSEMFDLLLSHLSIDVINVTPPLVEGVARRNDEGTIQPPEKGWVEEVYPYVLISLNKPLLVMTQTEIYYSDDLDMNVLNGIFERLVPYQQELIELGSNTAVAHELYVQWLLKWFGGRVNVRSIEFDQPIN